MRLIPSIQYGSTRGLARALTYGSMSCVRASRPVLAVTAGGSPYVNSGSSSATRGSISGLRMLAFTPCSVDPRTALRVTSLPVPAVVGTAINGSGVTVMIRPFPTPSRKSSGSPPLAAMAAIALPASIALPPPIAITTSQPAFCARRAPSRTRSTVGSPGMANVSAESALTSAAERSVEAPVNTSGRAPNVRASSGNEAAVPSPKIMRPAVANSKRIFLPVLRIGGDGVVLHAAPRLSHHGRYCIAPLRVMSGLFVRGGSLPRTISLDQHEPGPVVLLLHDVEACDAGFLNTRPGVLDGCPAEVSHGLRLDVHMHVNNEHQTRLRSYPTPEPRRPER